MRSEGAAEQCRDAEVIEGFGREEDAAQTLRQPRGDYECPIVPGGQGLQGLHLAMHFEIIRQGYIERVFLAGGIEECEIQQAIRIAVGIRIEPQRVYQTEDCRTRADTERER